MSLHTALSDRDHREAVGDVPEDPHAHDDYRERRQAEVVDMLRAYLVEFGIPQTIRACSYAVQLEEAGVRAPQER